MKKYGFGVFLMAVLAVAALMITPIFAAPHESRAPAAFVHGIVLSLDEGDYMLAGAPDGPGGITDIPGHYWSKAGPKQMVGFHYNTGPFEASNWWSSDAADGQLLYKVHAILAPWSPEAAERYAERGYVLDCTPMSGQIGLGESGRVTPYVGRC